MARLIYSAITSLDGYVADKIVYSRTLATVSSARTRIERALEPEADRQRKAKAGRDITVGGPDG